MKKVLSVVLCIILVISMSVTAFAADRTQKEYWRDYLSKNEGLTTQQWMALPEAERIAYDTAFSEMVNKPSGQSAKVSDTDAEIISRIKQTYNVDFELYYLAETDRNAVKLTPHLTNIENGLRYVGSSFMKKLGATLRSSEGGKFYIKLTPDNHTQAVTGYTYTAEGKYGWGTGGIGFTGYNHSPITVYLTIHELGHALDDAISKDATVSGSKAAIFSDNRTGITFSEGNGAIAGATVKSYDTNRYVTAYAASGAEEDYAETFYYAILRGADNPIQYGKDTAVYKKTLAIYNDLMAYVGADSRATQRVGGYLGL